MDNTAKSEKDEEKYIQILKNPHTEEVRNYLLKL